MKTYVIKQDDLYFDGFSRCGIPGWSGAAYDALNFELKEDVEVCLAQIQEFYENDFLSSSDEPRIVAVKRG